MKTLAAIVLVFALVFVASRALAGVGTFKLPWWTIDGGGGAASGGSYQLSGAIGQPDAGGMSGGSYSLTGGYWAGLEAPPPPSPEFKLYLPITR
jgi:hypothetical protein